MSKFIHCPTAIDMYTKNHTKHITTIFPQNAELLNVKKMYFKALTAILTCIRLIGVSLQLTSACGPPNLIGFDIR
jgi:hypothetical protein